MKERLQKAIARAGLASRRKAEELISAGLVKVNGITVDQLGTKVGPEDEIKVNNQTLTREEMTYYVINKPVRCISAVSDDHSRPTVVSLIDTPKRIYPVGRLDYLSSGVLLLTNDGEFTNLMTHPRYQIEKKYEVVIKGQLSPQELREIRQGVKTADEEYSPAKLTVLTRDSHTTRIIISIHEGKNREIRRIMEYFGHEVTYLHRVSFGCVTDAGLRPGEFRRLKPHELKTLKALALKGPANE